MIIRLDSIPDDGLSLDETRPVEWLTNFTDLVAGEGMTAAGPVAIQLYLTRMGEQVYIKGTIRVTIQTECARCLGQVTAEVEAPADVVLAPAGPGMEAKDAEDEGYGTYNGEEIDLAEHLRGQLVLYFPSRFLCKPDCKGLCSQCGVDLNREICRCDTEKVDLRWAALRKFKF